MPRKGKKGRRNQGDSDDDNANEKQQQQQSSQQQEEENEKGLSRKQKRQQKLAQKNKQQQNQPSNEDDSITTNNTNKRGGGGKNNKKGRRRNDFDSDDDDDGANDLFNQPKNQFALDSDDDDDDDDGKASQQQQQQEKPGKKLTKKQLKRLKEKQAAEERAAREAEEEEEEESNKMDIDDSVDNDDESEEEIVQPVKKLTKKQQKKLKEKQEAEARAKEEAMAAAFEDSESESEKSEEEEIVQPVKKLTKKQQKKLKAKQETKETNAFAAAFDDSDSESEKSKEEEEEEEKIDLAEELESKLQIADDDNDKKSKKKDKKEKKKKDKKDKKKTKKSKLELQIEEAMEKKKAEDNGGAEEEGEEASKNDEADSNNSKEEKEKKKKKKDKKEKKEKKKKKKDVEESEANKEEEGEEEKKEPSGKEEENEVFYGAPDDHAWTDASRAQLDAEAAAKEGPDRSLTHDKNGKKLSNKERKRLLKEREAAARLAEYEQTAAKASAEGAQFACSQTSISKNDPQWQNSVDINIPSFNISAAGKVLFQDSSFVCSHGRRYGLVGPNGKGKSTLLKMIASKDLILPPRVDFLYVEQEVVADDTPAVEAVLKADKERWSLLEEEKILSEKVDKGDDSKEVVERLQVVYEELSAMKADTAEAKARRILYGLGFDPEMQTKPTRMFSGGWRMRISLARALFVEPTLLMLDEPTNHLDLNAVIWLDDYLQKWKKTLLVVSHDQDFLNSVCDEIISIEDCKLAYYKGNYDTYKKAEKTKRKQLVKEWEKQEKRLRELKRSGQMSKSKAQTAVINKKREPGARAQKKKQADAIASGAASAETKELIKRPKDYTVKIEFTDVAELSRPVIEVNRVQFQYSPKHPLIFERIDFGIDMDSRICVVGPNGAGKSTLLKLLTGEIDPTKGDLRRNPRLRMGIYNQHFVDRLPMSKTPVQFLRDKFQDEDYQSIRNRLGKYGLEGHAHEVTMRDLSGGQKARVVFVELSLQRPHILLLDEPTNNLDIETIDALCDAVNQFNGGIVVVTHDQRLIEECDCELWIVDEQKVTPWVKGFDDYKENLLEEMEAKVRKEQEIREKRLEAAAKARAEKMAKLLASRKKK